MATPLIDLDLASVHLYLSVLELGSISKAAARHGLSQPSASQRIRKLERQLAITLLDRSTSGSALTPAGNQLAHACAKVADAASSLLAESHHQRDDQRLQVSIVTTPSLARGPLREICSALADVTPVLSLQLEVLPGTTEACTTVRRGEADLGLVDGPHPPLAVNHRVIRERELLVVVGARHPWASRADPVGPEELAASRLVLPPPGSGIRDAVEHQLSHLGHDRWNSTSSVWLDAATSEETCAMLAMSRELVGVLDPADVGPQTGGRLQVIPSSVSFSTPVRLIWIGNEPRTEGARRFAQTAADYGGSEEPNG